MPDPDPAAASVLARVRLTGAGGGAVRSLRGYDRSRHSPPEAVNATTSAFLARLCAAELAEEAEALFQATRAALGYKRTGLQLELAPAQALLTTRDFCWELSYALEPADPARYALTRSLHSLRRADLVRVPAFDALFAGRFDAVVFDLVRGLRVEALIDAIEAGPSLPAGQAADAAEHWPQVDYPSDCARCVLTVPGVAARVECDGASLALRLPRAASPAECLDAFEAVRAAFRLTRDPVLAGLLS